MDSVGLARVAAASALGILGFVVAPARADRAESVVVELWADRDDDDGDGRPDAEQGTLVSSNSIDLVPLDKRFVGAILQPVSGAEHARLVDGRGPLPWGRPAPPSARLQGVSPGRVELIAVRSGARLRLTLEVFGIDMRDGGGSAVDMARSHASLERGAPARVEGPPDAAYDDPDALRVVVSAPQDGPTFERGVAL
jgi:hypothetical protein